MGNELDTLRCCANPQRHKENHPFQKNITERKLSPKDSLRLTRDNLHAEKLEQLKKDSQTLRSIFQYESELTKGSFIYKNTPVKNISTITTEDPIDEI